MALGFAHQLVLGSDFLADQIAAAYWIAMYALTIAAIVVFRIGRPIQVFLRHDLRVANIIPEGHGTVSVYMTGRHLDELAPLSGQFFLWRFLAGNGWWRAHPFSLSAAPNGQYLRITVKSTGDATDDVRKLVIGTRVFAEGPYGAFTGAEATDRSILLIAGGIGVTPLRALLEDMPARPGALTLIYRASRREDVVFAHELDVLGKARGAQVHYLIGRRSALQRDPLDARNLRAIVPDIATREIYICGPEGMIRTVRTSLRRLRIHGSQIHEEHFAY
jgi:predicted ferric reductase